MVVMKMKFPFQKRVKLAQGLWLLSWSATVAGAMTFSLGCILKTELRRRAEVLFKFYMLHDAKALLFFTFFSTRTVSYQQITTIRVSVITHSLIAKVSDM